MHTSAALGRLTAVLSRADTTGAQPARIQRLLACATMEAERGRRGPWLPCVRRAANAAAPHISLGTGRPGTGRPRKRSAKPRRRQRRTDGVPPSRPTGVGMDAWRVCTSHANMSMSRQLEELQPSLQASLDASGAGGGGAAAAIVGSALAAAAGSLSALAERLMAAALSMSRWRPGRRARPAWNPAQAGGQGGLRAHRGLQASVRDGGCGWRPPQAAVA